MDLVYFCEHCRLASCPECFYLEHAEHSDRRILKDVHERSREKVFKSLEELERIVSRHHSKHSIEKEDEIWRFAKRLYQSTSQGDT